MGRQIKELQDQVSRYVRDYRRIYRLVHSEPFIKWYNEQNYNKRDLINFFVSTRRYVTLYKMYRKTLPLSEMSYRQLRLEAQKRQILNYSRMSKAELIYTISDYEEKHGH